MQTRTTARSTAHKYVTMSKSTNYETEKKKAGWCSSCTHEQAKQKHPHATNTDYGPDKQRCKQKETHIDSDKERKTQTTAGKRGAQKDDNKINSEHMRDTEQRDKLHDNKEAAPLSNAPTHNTRRWRKDSSCTRTQGMGQTIIQRHAIMIRQSDRKRLT